VIKKTIDENKIDPASSHILKYYIKNKIVKLDNTFFETLY